MAIAFVQEWPGDNATPGTAVGMTGPATTTGNLLILRVQARDSAAAITVTDPASNVWVLAENANSPTTFNGSVYYCLNAQSVSAVLVESTVSTNIRVNLAEFSGASGFGSSGQNFGPNQDSPWPPMELTVNPGELFFGYNGVVVTNRTIALLSSVPPWTELELSSGGQMQSRATWMIHEGSTTTTGPQWDITAGASTSCMQISLVFTEDTSVTDVVLNDKPGAGRAFTPREAMVESGTVSITDPFVGSLRVTGPGPIQVIIQQTLLDFPTGVRGTGPVEGSSGGTLVVGFPQLEVEFQGDVPSIAGTMQVTFGLLQAGLTGGRPDSIAGQLTAELPQLEVALLGQGPNSGTLTVGFPALVVQLSSTSEAPPVQDGGVRVRISIVDLVFPVRWPGWQWPRRRVR